MLPFFEGIVDKMADTAGNSKEEAERREAEEVKKIKEGEKEFR